ncbi:MAG: hypothetical protein ACU841_08100 [Gammaproteobacteria bacterium]
MSPAKWAGLFSLIVLMSGCQTLATPEQVTVSFWEAMADGDPEGARQFATQETRYLVVAQKNLEDASLKTGAPLIEGEMATVATVITLKKPQNNRELSFDTVLLRENDRWKVDYQQTLNNLSGLPFGDLFKSLRAIGDAIDKELENQIPMFEQQIRSFSEELIRQLDEFRKQLEKPRPPEKQKPYPGTI